MAQSKAYVDAAGVAVNWSTAVVSGVAQVDIFEVVSEDQHSNRYAWVRAGQRVDATKLAAAKYADTATGATRALTGTLTQTLEVARPDSAAIRYLPAGVSYGAVRGVQNNGTDTIRVAPVGTDTIDGGTASVTVQPGQVVQFQSDGAGAWTRNGGGGGGSASMIDRGSWGTGTSYVVGDVVTQATQRYVCRSAHISGTFSTDLAATKWVSLDPGAGVPLATSGQVPAQEPVAAAATANVGTQAAAARADHVHASNGLYGYAGTGADGDFVLDGTNTYAFMSKSGNTYTLSGPLFAKNLTVGAGVTLVTSCQILSVRGALTNNGTIRAAQGRITNGNRMSQLGAGDNGPAGGTGAGTAGVGSNGGIGNPDQNTNNAGGPGGAGAGGAGGTGGGHNNSYTFGQAPQIYTRQPLYSLARGVAQGVDVGGTGGPSSTMLTGSASGGAGGGDGTNTGGAGGAGGGVLLVNAVIVAGSGVFHADGAAGGTPSAGNCGGGGGGGGGWCIVNTADASGWTGTSRAAGGVGGTATGTGVNGTSGTVGAVIFTTWN